MMNNILIDTYLTSDVNKFSPESGIDSLVVCSGEAERALIFKIEFKDGRIEDTAFFCRNPENNKIEDGWVEKQHQMHGASWYTHLMVKKSWVSKSRIEEFFATSEMSAVAAKLFDAVFMKMDKGWEREVFEENWQSRIQPLNDVLAEFHELFINFNFQKDGYKCQKASAYITSLHPVYVDEDYYDMNSDSHNQAFGIHFDYPELNINFKEERYSITNQETGKKEFFSKYKLDYKKDHFAVTIADRAYKANVILKDIGGAISDLIAPIEASFKQINDEESKIHNKIQSRNFAIVQKQYADKRRQNLELAHIRGEVSTTVPLESCYGRVIPLRTGDND